MKETDPMDAFSISESFSDYLDRVYVTPPEPMAREELRMAFFAGAIQMRMTVDAVRLLPQGMRTPVLNRIDDELTDFMARHIKEDTPEVAPQVTTQVATQVTAQDAGKNGEKQ